MTGWCCSAAGASCWSSRTRSGRGAVGIEDEHAGHLAGGVIGHARVHLARLEAQRDVDTFRVSQLGGTLYWLVVGAGPFLLPLLWQTQFGWSPVKSGAVVLFIFAGNLGIKPATTPLINRFGFRTVLIASTLVMAAVMAALGFTTAATPLPVIAALTLVSGIVRSTALTVYNTVGFADMPAERMRDANTLFATTSQLGAGLAIAFATVALRAGRLLPGAASSGTLPYTVAFVLLACVALGVCAEALLLRPEAGDAARTRRPSRAAAAGDRS
ncbi:MAG TPA: MFS transporter [Trebonia sp.]